MFVSLPSFDLVFDELFRATRGLEPNVFFRTSHAAGKWSEERHTPETRFGVIYPHERIEAPGA